MVLLLGQAALRAAVRCMGLCGFGGGGWLIHILHAVHSFHVIHIVHVGHGVS
ncbi:hypothetical protein [Acetobacter papayae]|uniref:hypothetical protein n=1 Tax=Acetobacter papayae TaxID=1076592 RepID=UPI000AF5AFE0|nr:hypothetical protein [Acetobacter papayae]